MNHAALSNHIWAFFPWAVVLFSALGILLPVSLALVAGILSIVAVCATGLAGTRAAFAEDKVLLYWMAGLCALCFFSVIFSIAPQESTERALKITALVAVSLPLFVLARRFPASVKETVWRFLPIGLIFSGAVLVLELYLNFPIYKFVNAENDGVLPLYLANKNVAAFTLLFPVGIYAALKQGRRGIAGALCAMALAIFFNTDSQAAQCAMIVMVVTAAGMVYFRRLFVHGFFAALALLLITFPFFSQAAMEHLADPVSRYEQKFLGGATAAMRLENYSFISKRILEAPLTGHGVDTTRYMTFETEKKYFPDDTILHPHNVYLQIWLEFGVYGVVFFLGVLALIWRRMRRVTGHTQFLQVTFFCMLMVFLSISWSMWASWLIGMVFLFSAIVRMADVQDGG